MTIYRKLLPTEFPLYAEHLTRLSAADRYARFAGTVSDEAIRRHCQGMDWSCAALIGAFQNGVLIGAAEIRTDRALWPGSAELALSVDCAAQGHGVGGQLARRALTLARNRNITNVHMLCLTSNRRMLALARRFGGTAVTDGGETAVIIRMPPPNQFSLAREAMEDGAGVFTSVLDAMGTARPAAA